MQREGDSAVQRTSSNDTTTLFHDDFQSGFSAATWSVQPASFPGGTLEQGDGKASTSATGLTVAPTGTNPVTGQPAFIATSGQQPDGGGSDADHIKWLAFAQRLAGSGFPGFDIPATGNLTCTASLSAETPGTRQHPFGDAVTDPDADVRLAAADLVVADLQTGIVADFSLTNSQVFVVYERLRAPGSDYASFAYAVPVAARTPGQYHDLGVRVDEGGNRVAWLVDGEEVMATDQIGYRTFPRKYQVLDHGGTEERLTLRQVITGFALVTVLDAAGQDGAGLVRLDSTPDFYFHPRHGAPTPQSFHHAESTPGARLWGQGVILRVRHITVTAAS